MTDTTSPRTRVPRARQRAVTGIAVLTLLGAVAVGWHASSSPPGPSLDAFAGDHSDSPDSDGGALPDGASAFDEDLPGLAKLDPALRGSLQDAALEAENDGVTFTVTSGWRSPEYQNQLLDDAVEQYGSREEAARWVATAETSTHVSGEAVDVGPYDAIDWLVRHGADYGLCQIYANESWHYELRPEAAVHGCPTMYTDPTEDPRMRP